MRSAAQVVAYEIAMGFALVGVLDGRRKPESGVIVEHQRGAPLHWNLVWLFPLFLVYFIAGVAETNRAPFDVAEGESEIVAGFHVEYPGSVRAVFPGRIRQHDPDCSADRGVLSGRLLSPFDGYLGAGSAGARRAPAGLMLGDGTTGWR